MSVKIENSFIAIIAIIVALVILVLCIVYIISNRQNQMKITDGFVIDKQYSPALGGKYGYSAQYTVTIQNSDGIQASYAVTPLLYDRLNIGDYIENVNQALK